MKITAYIKHTAVAALVVTIFAACSTDENFYYQDTNQPYGNNLCMEWSFA